MRRLLPLLLTALLAGCVSERAGNIGWDHDEKYTDVPAPLRAAFREAGTPNISRIIETRVRQSNSLRTDAYSLQHAGNGIAVLDIRYVSLFRDETTGAIKRSGCASDSGSKVYSATHVILGGGLFLAGRQDTAPCVSERQHYHDVSDLNGQLFPMAVGRRLSFEVKGKNAYGGRILGWLQHERYTYEVVDKQNGYRNGFVSVAGDVFRIRVTIEDLQRRNSRRTNELFWSETLKWVVARKRGNWGQGNFVDTWSSDTVAIPGTAFVVSSPSRDIHAILNSAKGTSSDDELWQITLGVFQDEALQPVLVALRAEEAQRRAENKQREDGRNNNRETADQLLGLASALAGGMMASEGARTGNTAMMNQGSELLVRGGVAAATGDPEDSNDLAKAIVNQPAVGNAGGANPATGAATNARQFTPEEEKQIADRLTRQCQTDTEYTRQMTQCRANKHSQAPCYLAATRLCECFLEKDPRDHRATDPRVARHHTEWEKCRDENQRNAARLQSNSTVYSPGR